MSFIPSAATRIAAAALALFALVASARAQAPVTPPASLVAAPVTPADHLRAAKTWGYQLVGLDVARLAATDTGVLVIDYARDGSAATVLVPADLERLKRRPDGGRRVVLAYLSIGEAEDYRFYWNRWWGDLWFITNPFGPSWRSKQNGDWGGNYAVRYWDPRWQEIVLGSAQYKGYLDRILEAGFDGVWLDKVDSALEDVARANPNARADMIMFVRRIADKARGISPGFLVVPQNGEELLAEPGYRAIIDGIGKESLLFGEPGEGRPNTQAAIASRTGLLQLAVAEKKPVLAVEYLGDAAAAEAARGELARLGFVPLRAVRALDRLPGEFGPVAAGAAPDAGDAPDRRRGGRGSAKLLGAGALAALFGAWLIWRRLRT